MLFKDHVSRGTFGFPWNFVLLFAMFPLRRHENIMTVRSVFKDPYSLIINFPRVFNLFETFFYKLDDLREKSYPYRINSRGKSYFSGGPNY